MTTKNWRIGTRVKGQGRKDWDIGLTEMTPQQAQEAAEELDRKYPGFEHRAFRIGGKKKK